MRPDETTTMRPGQDRRGQDGISFTCHTPAAGAAVKRSQSNRATAPPGWRRACDGRGPRCAAPRWLARCVARVWPCGCGRGGRGSCHMEWPRTTPGQAGPRVGCGPSPVPAAKRHRRRPRSSRLNAREKSPPATKRRCCPWGAAPNRHTIMAALGFPPLETRHWINNEVLSILAPQCCAAKLCAVC